MEYKIVDNNGDYIDPADLLDEWKKDGKIIGRIEDLFNGALHDLKIFPVIDVTKHPSIEVNPIIRDGRRTDYSLKAEISGDPGIYEEISVSIYDKAGNCVGDAYFTVDEESGEPKIMMTLGGDGDGDKELTVYPLRELHEKAVIFEVS